MAVQRKGAAQPRQPAAERTGLAELYEHDYYSWTGAQVQALRERKIAELDWDNLAEEVEDLGKAERHRLESHLEGLLMHLLKWSYQPRRRRRSWSNSIEEHRFRAHRELRKNPGLKSALPEIFAEAYDAARFGARRETGLELNTFPQSSPWSLDDTLRNDFYPRSLQEVKEGQRPNRSSTNR